MILDTNALSALAERDAALLLKLRAAAHVYLPIIALGEFRYGLENSRYRAELLAWFETLVGQHPVLTVELETLPHYATIRKELKAAGTPIPANDVWIAAMARQQDLPVVSNDTDFDRVSGLRRIGW